MKGKITLLILLLLINVHNVNAITLIPKDSEIIVKKSDNLTASSSVVNNSSCSGSSSFTSNNSPLPDSDTIVIGRTTFSRLCNETAPYNVVIMVDNTGSMKLSGKKAATNATIKNIIKVFSEKAPDSRITLLKFNTTVSDKKVIEKASNGYNENYLTDIPDKNTNLQRAYKNAYKILNEASSNDKRKFVPFVIIITDGYPTSVCSNTNSANINCEIVENDSGGPYNAYLTARTLSNLRTNIVNRAGYANALAKNTRVVTVGVGMDERDEYVRFMINPNKDNYNKLNKSIKNLWTVESKNLYQYLESGKKPTEAKDTICRCRQAHEKILYDKGRNFKNTIQWQVNRSLYENCDIKCSDSGYVNLSSGYKVDSWLKDNAVTANFNSSDANAIRDGISDFIAETLKCNEKIIKDENSLDYTSDYKKIVYTENSVNKSINIENAPLVMYYKVPNEITVKNKDTGNVQTIDDIKFYYDYNPNEKLDPSKGVSCIRIDSSKLGMSLVITEESNITLGNFSDVPYKGNGFTMNGAGITNVISYEYASSTNSGTNNYLNFNISLARGGYLITGKEEDYSLIHEPSSIQTTGFSHVGINNLYSDSNCTSNIRVNDLISSTDIWSKIGLESLELGNFIKTVDSNDKDNENAIVKTSMTETKSGTGSKKTYSYSILLNKACITTVDNKYNGIVYKNGDVRYLDNINGDCGDNYINGINENNENLYYIPIEYDKDKVYLTVDDVNVSNVSGIDINYSLKCSVDIEKKNNLKFNYRVIDVSDPFPKGNIPSNWKDWMNVASNRSRLSSTYTKQPIYILNANKYSGIDSSANSLDDINNYTDYSYTEWFGMNDNGTSDFVCGNKIGFSTKTCLIDIGSFCKLGMMDNNCDRVTGG